MSVLAFDRYPHLGDSGVLEIVMGYALNWIALAVVSSPLLFIVIAKAVSVFAVNNESLPDES